MLGERRAERKHVQLRHAPSTTPDSIIECLRVDERSFRDGRL